MRGRPRRSRRPGRGADCGASWISPGGSGSYAGILLVNQFAAKLFPEFEVDEPVSPALDALSAAAVAACTPVPVPQAEAAEASQIDPVPLAEELVYAVKEA